MTVAPATLAIRTVQGQDKYVLEDGQVFMTGLQALVRILLDQHRLDARRGLRTATMVSGYPGSPVAGFDKELMRARKIAEEHDVVFRPGVNEELGVTAVMGSQMATSLNRRARFDGVLGMWYGKAPGVDRSGDALRHANFLGVTPTGGVLAVAGDDPVPKSSSLPSASEFAFVHHLMPIVYPGDLQDVLDLGLHGFNLSRASGCWTAFKLVTDVADQAGTVAVGPDRVQPVMPVVEYRGQAYAHKPNGRLITPHTLEMEQNLVYARLKAAREYAWRNDLNRVAHGSSDAWLGILTAGRTYFDLMQAFQELGLDDADLERHGIRILKMGMIYPFETRSVDRFVDGLQEVLVVEEKRPFLEMFLKEHLYNRTARPLVVGKDDEEGRRLLPVDGELSPALIAEALVRRLRRLELTGIDERLERLRNIGARQTVTAPLRTPFYCSGCPHNRSTQAAPDTLVGPGTGCHGMVLLMDPDTVGDITCLTQMGGEGVQWVGMSPFTEGEHFVQNLGDGTFFHSGQTAMRAAIAADVNITYKLLYNGHVAMTGAQDVEGLVDVPAMTRILHIDGVKAIIVTTDDLERYSDADLAPGVRVWPRERLDEAAEELARVKGVSVLIHDQECAAEQRRLRKRGERTEPTTRIHINERVCEGCGDCGEKSMCMSVQPVDTEFGRKTQIHQSSCNKDYSCLAGDCPSFLTIEPDPEAKGPARDRWPAPPSAPAPALKVPAADFTVRLLGVGGTGVVTASQVLGMAAHLEGRHVYGLDQMGLAQKGGPVVSDIRIAAQPVEGLAKATEGRADLYLVVDLLGAVTKRNLAAADPERTIAVVSTTKMPTGRMVVDTSETFPRTERLTAELERVTRAQDSVFFDAEALSAAVFGDHMPANIIALGVAFQAGALGLSAEAIERAIEINGTAAKRNRDAFRWGRAVVSHPGEVGRLLEPPAPTAPAIDPRLARRLQALGVDGELRRLLEIRLPELVAYQSRRYAEQYLDVVAWILQAERQHVPASTALTEAVARSLHKLMAYKDEYEVARLHLDELERLKITEAFGPNAKVSYKLHPPMLRAMGMDRKLTLGPWFTPALRALTAGKRLRGTRADPFGRAHVRVVERQLPGEYQAAIETVVGRLSVERHPLACQIAALPDIIRGYEEIKLRNVERYRRRLGELLGELESPPPIEAGLPGQR